MKPLMSELILEDFDVSPRVILVVPHAGLRGDLHRSLESSGFDVDSFVSPEQTALLGDAGPRGVYVVDLDGFEGKPPGQMWTKPAGRTIWLSSGADLPMAGIGPGVLVLTKPFSVRALESAIRDCLDMNVSDSLRSLDPVLMSQDPVMCESLDRSRRLAGRELAIAIEGELGTGRKLLARRIHAWSGRGRERCIELDRMDIDAAGAAKSTEVVYAAVEAAYGGSLILGEPADWPRATQGALCAALRVDAGRPRCLTTTRHSLEQRCNSGELSVELYDRLDVAVVTLPPLRDRHADHLELCRALARRVARALGRETPVVDEALVEAFAREGFPGNRIGLESRLRAALIRSDADAPTLALSVGDSPGEASRRAAEQRSLDLKQLERDTIVRALAHWDGNRTRASESLGISVRTLRNKIRDYGLR